MYGVWCVAVWCVNVWPMCGVYMYGMYMCVVRGCVVCVLWPVCEVWSVCGWCALCAAVMRFLPSSAENKQILRVRVAGDWSIPYANK